MLKIVIAHSNPVSAQLQHGELGEMREIFNLGYLVLNEVEDLQLGHPLQTTDQSDVVERQVDGAAGQGRGILFT